MLRYLRRLYWWVWPHTPIPGISAEHVDLSTDGYDRGCDHVDRLRDGTVLASYVVDGAHHGAEDTGRHALQEQHHKVMLDLDVPAKLLRSGRRGHTHLYIDVDVPWSVYARLLEVMGEAGILEPGFVSASLDREHTDLRAPWRLKPVRTVGDARQEELDRWSGRLAAYRADPADPWANPLPVAPPADPDATAVMEPVRDQGPF